MRDFHAIVRNFRELANAMQPSLSIPVLLTVALGGGLGAVARYALTLWAVQRFGTGFPWGTLLVNALGALLVGALIALLQERTLVGEYWRPLIIVGCLGSLTTFSMFSVELLQFIERGNWALAIGYLFASVVLCVALVALGMQAGRAL